MSRILKFRAWINRKNELIYLKGFRYSGNEKIKITFADKDEDDCTYTFLNKDVYLEQFTGLHDKNGVEIYEGDIVYGTIKGLFGQGYQNGIVKYGEYGFVIDLKKQSWEPGIGMVGFCSFEDYEVIGNIHEVEEDET